MSIPKDPFILLSFINTKLRDTGKDFNSVCDDLDADSAETMQKLNSVGFEYDEQTNQFK